MTQNIRRSSQGIKRNRCPEIPLQVKNMYSKLITESGAFT